MSNDPSLFFDPAWSSSVELIGLRLMRATWSGCYATPDIAPCIEPAESHGDWYLHRSCHVPGATSGVIPTVRASVSLGQGDRDRQTGAEPDRVTEMVIGRLEWG